MKSSKNNLILYGRKCECNRFVDFTKEMIKVRREVKLDFIEMIKEYKREVLGCDEKIIASREILDRLKDL